MLNLYKYHNKPESLKAYKELHVDISYQEFWAKFTEEYDEDYGEYDDMPDDFDIEYKNRSQIEDNPMLAYEYANYIGKRFPEGEAAIATDEFASYMYTKDVLKGERFPEIENAIATDARYSYMYAKDVLKGERFPEGEAAIATDVDFSYQYARDVLKSERVTGIEKAIAKSRKYSYEYAKNVINGRFPEGEAAIATDGFASLQYARDILKGERVPEIENAIATDASYSYMYAKDILKGRFPEGERLIMNSNYKDDYLKFLKEKGIES